ncbi:dihydroneopterin aldolase [Marinobacter sp.]|uniref:dihydroneopterin aldolase n=1 Tax=Marinobacter sp. TaxID=50741 RepID=UPI00384B1AEA
MTDTVLIEGLAVDAVIGVYGWEREISQQLLIDLELAWDNLAPGESDDLSHALDYAAVCEVVVAHFRTHQPQLLEAAAEALAGKLREDFGVPWLRLVIRKPGAVPQARSVGVSIERGNRP